MPIYRKRVRHRTAKNFQLDLFNPNDGSYKYSVVARNLSLTIRNLWHFMPGHGDHEKPIGQVTIGLVFHTLPTNAYAANSPGQVLAAWPTTSGPDLNSTPATKYGRSHANTPSFT